MALDRQLAARTGGCGVDRSTSIDDVWKGRERTSTVAPNRPAALFRSFMDREKKTFRSS